MIVVRQALRVVGTLALTLVVAGAFAQGLELREGRDYQVLRPAQPTGEPAKIVVTEFFSWQCPHCYAFSGPLRQWVARLPKDVVCTRESVAIGHESWEASARAFYALQTMGKAEGLDAGIFAAIHRQRAPMLTESHYASWLGAHNVSPVAFVAAYRSFGVNVQWQRGKQLAATYRLPAVPSLIIDGKYLVSIVSNIDFAVQLARIDTLIAKVRADKARGR